MGLKATDQVIVIPRTRSPQEPPFESMPQKPEMRNESQPLSVVDRDHPSCRLYGRA
jgi:hypothetical protein